MNNSGIFTGISFGSYLQIDAVSNSYLGRLNKCPAAAHVVTEDTPALVLGRAMHTAILEGMTEFSNRYFVLPDVDKRTKDGKAIMAACIRENEGRYPLTSEDNQRILAMRDSVMAHPWASKLLAEGVSEQTIIWNDTVSGLLCKARPDRLPGQNKSTLIDLKTTQDAGDNAFIRSAVKYGYARQAAFYMDGLNAISAKNNVYRYDTFVFIVVEKEAPYRVEVYALDDEFVQYGRDEYRKLLTKEKICRATGKYPAYAFDGITTLFKPAYL